MIKSSWSRGLVIGGLLATGYRGLIVCFLVVALHSHIESAFWASFLDHELLLCCTELRALNYARRHGVKFKDTHA